MEVISKQASVMIAAHALARRWMAKEDLVGDYQDFLRLALRLAWDLARGVTPRVPVWASDLTLPAEAKALCQVGPATNSRPSFEVADGENPFTAFRAAFGCAARWGWVVGGPTGHLLHLWAEQIAAAKVVATCHHKGEDHIFWS